MYSSLKIQIKPKFQVQRLTRPAAIANPGEIIQPSLPDGG